MAQRLRTLVKEPNLGQVPNTLTVGCNSDSRESSLNPSGLLQALGTPVVLLQAKHSYT